MKKAIYAGSFDPFTMGHKDIVDRASEIFDEVTVVIAVSPTKKPLLVPEERKKVIEDIFCDNKKISVDTWSGLLVDYAKSANANFFVRGLRPTGDFEIEFQMASMNKKLAKGIETVFLTTSENLYYISSSLVKEVFSHGGDISKFVPIEVSKLLDSKKGT